MFNSKLPFANPGPVAWVPAVGNGRADAHLPSLAVGK